MLIPPDLAAENLAAEDLLERASTERGETVLAVIEETGGKTERFAQVDVCADNHLAVRVLDAVAKYRRSDVVDQLVKEMTMYSRPELDRQTLDWQTGDR